VSSSHNKSHQPSDKKTLSCLMNCKRNFMPHWYKTWLSICITKQKVFCFYCRYAEDHAILNFSKRGEDTFTTKGFNNREKALEKFKIHSLSITHREAVIKFEQLQQPPVTSYLETQTKKSQASR